MHIAKFRGVKSTLTKYFEVHLSHIYKNTMCSSIKSYMHNNKSNLTPCGYTLHIVHIVMLLLCFTQLDTCHDNRKIIKIRIATAAVAP